MGKKVSLFALSLILTIVVFILLINFQKKIVSPYGNIKVYYSIVNIDKNTVFNKDNFGKYFVLKNVSKNLLVDGYITDKNELLDTYTKVDIYKGEQLSLHDVDKNAKRLAEIPNKVETSIKFSDIGEVVGGTLKEGDLIDIILTDSSTNKNTVVTQTQLKNILISKTFSADGTLINRANNDKKSALTLNLILSAENAHKLENAVARGKIKVIKKIDDSNYNDITIETAK